MDEKIKEVNEETTVKPENIEIQTTFNNDGLFVLCEGAEIENEERSE